MLKNIRFGRVLVGGLMSEVGVIAALLLGIGVHSSFSLGVDARFADVGEQVGYYVAPPAGVLTTLLAALWVARPLRGAFVAHGVLVGVVSVLLTVGFLVGARPEHRAMYVIAFALRIVGGYAGGAIARWRFLSQGAGSPAVTRHV